MTTPETARTAARNDFITTTAARHFPDAIRLCAEGHARGEHAMPPRDEIAVDCIHGAIALANKLEEMNAAPWMPEPQASKASEPDPVEAEDIACIKKNRDDCRVVLMHTDGVYRTPPTRWPWLSSPSDGSATIANARHEAASSRIAENDPRLYQRFDGEWRRIPLIEPVAIEPRPSAPAGEAVSVARAVAERWLARVKLYDRTELFPATVELMDAIEKSLSAPPPSTGDKPTPPPAPASKGDEEEEVCSKCGEAPATTESEDCFAMCEPCAEKDAAACLNARVQSQLASLRIECQQLKDELARAASLSAAPPAPPGSRP